jgi:hypothetical protein
MLNDEQKVEPTSENGNSTKPHVLRSCPFCGCDNVELKQYARNGWQVKCKRCLMGLKQKTLRYSMDWLKQQMIDAWNARA